MTLFFFLSNISNTCTRRGAQACYLELTAREDPTPHARHRGGLCARALFANKLSWSALLNRARQNSVLWMRPSATRELLTVLNNSYNASTSFTVTACSEPGEPGGVDGCQYFARSAREGLQCEVGVLPLEPAAGTTRTVCLFRQLPYVQLVDYVISGRMCVRPVSGLRGCSAFTVRLPL